MAKVIEGSWFEFQHSLKEEGQYYNQALARFTAQDWDLKVKEAAELGLEYLVLMMVAAEFKSFYKTDLLPMYGIDCEDPIEAVLSAADKYNVKFFIGNDWFDNQFDWERDLNAPESVRMRQQAMNELCERYGHHPSFYGWYWPNEPYLIKGFPPEYIEHFNTNAKMARALMPKAKLLSAPYGTGVVPTDDHYLRQLDSLDIDIVAYQDEIGCRRHQVEDLPRIWEGLRKLHDKIERIQMWADIEMFEFPGEVGKSALLPAPFSRVQQQLEIAGDFVDKILIYQFQGLMNKADSPVFAGPPQSAKLYEDYVAWKDKVQAQDLVKL